jgi:N-acetylneuraminate synthase
MENNSHKNIIGTRKSCFIIAEAGVNHNGSLKIAKQLIDVAKNAKVDAIKFQTFHAEQIVSIDTEKAQYQYRVKEKTQYDMLKNLELSFDDFRIINEYCKEKKIEFISTPYDIESVKFLNELGVEKFKIASADLINKPLIEAVAKTNKIIILGCGMATLGEIEKTISFIRKLGNSHIQLLHCTTSYPADYKDVNMKVMDTLRKAFSLPVGYSDHTMGITIPILAVSLGAQIIEKHFTLDRTMVGPDHFASLEPEEIKKMVEAIRTVELSLGVTQKVLTADEKKNLFFMRRSFHLNRNMEKGNIISIEDLKITRPFDGIEPWELEIILGRELKIDKKENEPLKWEDLA